MTVHLFTYLHQEETILLAEIWARVKNEVAEV